MGDRVSISFRKEGEESVVLFNHWGGSPFPKKALAYAKKLKDKYKDDCGMPLGRLEPETVMVDFIRHLTKDMKRVESSLYLGKTEDDGDNSDNGHFIIDLDKMEIDGICDDEEDVEEEDD